jgi:hypothetical protein
LGVSSPLFDFRLLLSYLNDPQVRESCGSPQYCLPIASMRCEYLRPERQILRTRDTRLEAYSSRGASGPSSQTPTLTPDLGDLLDLLSLSTKLRFVSIDVLIYPVQANSSTIWTWIKYKSLAAWSGVLRSLQRDWNAFRYFPFFMYHLGDSVYSQFGPSASMLWTADWGRNRFQAPTTRLGWKPNPTGDARR